MSFLERRSKVNGSTKLGISQVGSRRVFLFYNLWKHLFASLAYGFCHELKIGTTCSLESVKAERQIISACLQKQWTMGALCCHFANIQTQPLLRFSVKLTGRCQGGEWSGLWGQSRQKAAPWERMLSFVYKPASCSLQHTLRILETRSSKGATLLRRPQS